MSVRPAGIGRLSALLAVLGPLLIAGLAAVGGFHEELLRRALEAPTFAAQLMGTVGCAVLLMFALGALVLRQQRRRPRRAQGRARLSLLAVGVLLQTLGAAATIALLWHPTVGHMLDSGLGLVAPRGRETWYQMALALIAVGSLLVMAGSIASFLLLSPVSRKRVWWVVDGMLLAGTAYAITALPTTPGSDGIAQLGLAVVRHLITTLAALRLLVRLMPLILDGIESLGFQPLVAARHLRSKKSGFLAAISMLSVLAVTVSCMALTTTLSVMGGFRNDLKRKILGSNAHIVLDREHGEIHDWPTALAATESAPGVSGASPFVGGEVMLSSASNHQTAILRGVDPRTVGRVSDLPNNMKSGKLEYLEHPEKLLDLPPDAMRSPFGRLGSSVLTPEPSSAANPDAGVDAAVLDAPDAGTAKGESGELDMAAERKNLETRIARLEAFLRDTDPPPPQNDEREVLPGIVIGQELARALRLYVGDEVNVVAPLGELGPSGPMPKARPFRVAGIFYSGMYEYDMKFTYVALPTAQRFLGTGDAISGIEVRVDDIDQAPTVAASIRAGLGRPELRVRDWQDLNSRLFGALALEKLAMFIALGIAILVASFCIAGTLTLMVQEKGREVAIMKAMGTSDRTIVSVFVLEGGLIGLLGAGLGLFLGYMACFAAEHFGIRMNPEVYYIDRLPVHVDTTEFVLTGVAAVFVCLLVTIYPALLASRLRPVDALRYE